MYDTLPGNVGGIMSKNNGNERTLFMAVSDGDLEEVKALLAKGADVNAVERGETPLQVAAQDGHWEIANALNEAIERNFKYLPQLKLKINEVVDSYKGHSSKNLTMFHHHGKKGRGRAEDFKRELDKVTTIEQLKSKVHDYLSGSKNGNTHPHSFRTMLLSVLKGGGFDKKELKGTSKNFKTELADFENTWGEFLVSTMNEIGASQRPEN